MGAIVDFLVAPDDPGAVIEAMAAPTTKIVSLTITEGGYNISSTTGEFVLDDPAVAAADLSRTRRRAPRSGSSSRRCVDAVNEVSRRSP